MQNIHRVKRGFTLIELLVVIAIIAILASILFPVFARARENARRTSCLSNLKQMGLASMQYIQDYDGHYPFTYYDEDLDGNPDVAAPDSSWPGAHYSISANNSAECPASGNRCMSFQDALFPYIKSWQVFTCPSSASPATLNYGYNAAFGGFRNSYSKFCGSTSCGANWQPITESNITRPSEVIVFMDHNWGYSYLTSGYYMQSSAKGSNPKSVAPHLDGGNAVYADGHAKWRNVGVMKAIGASTSTCDPQNPDPSISYCSEAWNPYIP